MPTSNTDIVNTALRLIGGGRITSLTDGSKNANAANDIFTGVRDDLLRSHNWKFATKLATMARLATAPAFGFDYAYALPSDWLRTVSLHDNDAGTGTVSYEEAEVASAGALMCSIETAYLRYVYTVTDPNRFSQDFRKALESALARDLSVPVAQSNTLQEKYEAQARSNLRKAKSSDSFGSPPPQRPAGSWAASRQSWPSSKWPR